MIVDVHAHCGQPEHSTKALTDVMVRAGYSPPEPYTFDQFAEEMEVVDKALVFGVRALASGERSPNEFTVEWVKNDPDKFIGFMAIDPTEDDHLEQIDRCVELGLRGIKLHPISGRYNPADPTLFPMYERAQRIGLPIVSHFGTHPGPRTMLKYSSPLLVDEIAQAFPDLKFVMAHMGHPWQRDAAVVLRKHPNVYADVSAVWVRPWQGWEALIGMIEWGVADKLLFGSDFPAWTPREGMDKMRRLNDQVKGTNLPHIPDEVIEGIINRNALELLGLE